MEGVVADLTAHARDIAARIVPGEDAAERPAVPIDQHAGLGHAREPDRDDLDAAMAGARSASTDGGDRRPDQAAEVGRIELGVGAGAQPRRRVLELGELAAVECQAERLMRAVPTSTPTRIRVAGRALTSRSPALTSRRPTDG